MFWFDKWLSIGAIRNLISSLLSFEEDNLLIKDVGVEGAWNLNLCSFNFHRVSYF